MRLDLLADPVPLLTDRQLRYDPTGEWIFPSLLDCRDLPIAGPERWLLAYSPHDAPGGICLARGDRLLGAWSEDAANPVIAERWDGHYAVSHVASPHLLWLPELQAIACYFHGENDTTRVALSPDGRHWRYHGVALSVADVPGWRLDECSYARVASHRLPDEPDCRYIMLFMGKEPDPGAPGNGSRCLFCAWSPDGLRWTARHEPVVVPEPPWQTSGPQLIRRADGPWILHHHDIMHAEGHLYATPVDEALVRRGATVCLLRAGDRPTADGRLADPLLVTEDGQEYLIWLEGRRLHGGFVIAPVKLEPG